MSSPQDPRDRARNLIAQTLGAPVRRTARTTRAAPAAPLAEESLLDRSGFGFRTRYPAARLPGARNGHPRTRLLLGVSTFNRQRYVQRLIDSFVATRNPEYDWTLVIADDGSTDGTVEYLRNVEIDGCTTVVIENKNRTITGQTNSILATALFVDPEVGFKADDDIYFTQPGWDDLYLNAVRSSGFHHLIYHNPEWKAPSHNLRENALASSVAAIDTMGCFWTFSPSLLEDIGYFDEVNFPFRGHAHLDFTIRACRAGHNTEDTAWDAADSTEYIDMWSREEYVDLIDWDSPTVRSALSDEERKRRLNLIAEPDRVHLDHRSAEPIPHLPTARVTPSDPELESLLNEHSVARTVSPNWPQVDGAFVLNLDADRNKWTVTAGMLARCGLEFERFPAVDGGTEDNVAEWRAYEARGLELPLEQQISRRLIQSSGAWGYLKTMRAVLARAKENRHRSILVFDDDIMVHRQAREMLLATLAGLPDQSAVVYLGSTQVEPDEVTEFDETFYHPGLGANGSFAVHLDSSVFDLLIESIDRFDGPFDGVALRDVSRARPDDVYAMWTPLVIADVSTSTIRKPREMAEYAERFGWDLDNYERRSPETSPLVSVIIVGTDIEAELPRTLESLRWQTEPRIEVLVGSNASRDNTSRVLADLRKRDTRIRGFHTESPVSDAELANLLIRRCVGNWVSALPAEANLPRSHYETLLRTAEESSDATYIATAAVGERVPARINDDSSARRRRKTFYGGLVRRPALVAVGGFVDLDESGLREVVDRIAAKTGSPHGPSTPAGDRSTSIWISPGHSAKRRPEYGVFHAEIAKGQRAARLPSPSGIRLVELI